MPPKKLKSIGRKKPVRRVGGTTGIPFTQRAPRRTPMTVQIVQKSSGHGVTEPYATGRPGAFQAAFNPFETPAAGRTTFASRFNTYTIPTRPDFSQEAIPSVNQSVLGIPQQFQVNDFVSRPMPTVPSIPSTSGPIDLIGYNDVNTNVPPSVSEDSWSLDPYTTPFGNRNAEALDFASEEDSLVPYLDSDYNLGVYFTPEDADAHARYLENLARAYNTDLSERDQQFINDRLRRNTYEDDATPLLSNERRRPTGERYGLDPYDSAQVRLSFGQGSSRDEYHRARGYLRDDSVVSHSTTFGDQMLNSDGYSQHSSIFSPHTSSIHSDPMHVVGIHRPTTSNTAHLGFETPSIHDPIFVGPPITPVSGSAHSVASAELTPPMTGGPTSGSGVHPMYTGIAGAGATIPAEGGYININYPQQIPSLLDLAPAADLPVQTFGSAVLGIKSASAGQYWNANRHGVAVFG